MTGVLRVRRWLRRLAGALGILLLLLGGWLLYQEIASRLFLNRVLRELRADGVPLTWEEFERSYDVPEPEAVEKLLRALEGLYEIPPLTEAEQALVPIEGCAIDPAQLDTPFAPEMLEALRVRVEQMEPQLDALRSVLTFAEPLYSPVTNLDHRTSHIIATRQAAHILRMAALDRALAGDAHEAQAMVTDEFRLAAAMRGNELLIDAMMRTALQSDAVNSLQWVLAKLDLAPGKLGEWDEHLAVPLDISDSLRGELVFTAMMFEKSRYSCDGSDWRTWLRWPGSGGWMRMNEAYILQLHAETIRMWGLPWDEFERRHKMLMGDVPMIYGLVHIYDHNGRMKERELWARGLTECARIGIAIEKYLHDEHRLPDRLGDLVPAYMKELPTGPFYGEPFTYKREGRRGVIRFDAPEDISSGTFTVVGPPDG